MKSLFITGILISLGCLYAGAQEIEDADTVITDLDEIIVSGNRWEQNLREVPSKVVKINSSLVQFQNPQTAADLLGVSNGVFIQKSQLGGGSPMIRGFATNRVLLVVDGVRMNNAIFRSGNVQNVISLDPLAVQEAEVIFGPGSVIYGSDAIGGVMDFHTLKPTFSDDGKTSFHGNALTRYSTANKENTAHIDFNIGLKKWSFLTSATRSVYDDLRMGSDGPEEYTRPDYVDRQNGDDVIVINSDPDVQVQTGYDQWNAMQKISFQANEWTNATYSLHYSKTSDYPRYDRLILAEDGALANAEWYYGPQKWIMHSLNLSYSKPSILFDQSKLVLGYQEFEESRHNRGFGGARRTDRTENVNAFSVNFDLDKKINDALTFFYGAEYITNEVKSVGTRQDVNSGEVTPTSTRYPDGSDWRSAAAYVSLKIKPDDQWTINLSNRFTSVYTYAKYDRTFFDFPFEEASLRNKSMNGSLGLIFSPTSSLKLYSNFSSAFRAPNVDDIGKVFDSEPGNVVIPNPDLEAERAYSAELGFASIFGETFKLDLAGYYTTIDNAIARGTSTFNGQDSIDYDGVLSRVLSQQNLSEIWVAGIQAGVDWQFADRFKVSSTLNYQKGKEKDPETGRDFSPTHVAPMFGSTHFIYAQSKIKADLYANYNGEISADDLALTERADSHLYAKDNDGNPYAPSWWTLNAKGEFRLSEHLAFSAGIENILDKRYRPYASGISAPGRNFIVSIRAHL
jgi:hemoglobin/transferrin/lactoferrin receptor protein